MFLSAMQLKDSNTFILSSVLHSGSRSADFEHLITEVLKCPSYQILITFSTNCLSIQIFPPDEGAG